MKYLEHFFAEAEHLRVTASEGLWAFYPIFQKLVEVLSTPFMYNANQLLFDAIFYRKGFSEQAIEIWILILQYIFLLLVKKNLH